MLNCKHRVVYRSCLARWDASASAGPGSSACVCDYNYKGVSPLSAGLIGGRGRVSLSALAAAFCTLQSQITSMCVILLQGLSCISDEEWLLLLTGWIGRGADSCCHATSWTSWTWYPHLHYAMWRFIYTHCNILICLISLSNQELKVPFSYRDNHRSWTLFHGLRKHWLSLKVVLFRINL